MLRRLLNGSAHKTKLVGNPLGLEEEDSDRGLASGRLYEEVEGLEVQVEGLGEGPWNRG